MGAAVEQPALGQKGVLAGGERIITHTHVRGPCP